MEEKFYEVFTPGSAEVVIKKSKFIGETFSVRSEEEVAQTVAKVKKKYYDARHHCYAYCLSDENAIRASDDGEPQGTAGRPILDVLLGEGMRYTLVIVTRYFGGTLLGTGGLTRAYHDAAKAVIDETEKLQRLTGVECTVTIGYELIGKLENLLKEKSVNMLDTSYGEKVEFDFVCDQRLAEEIDRKIVEFTSGATGLNISDSKNYGLVNNRVIWL